MDLAKDLFKESPRSPRIRIGGYAILARIADKGRAFLNGTAGEYSFDCPVDNMLFDFKGVTGAEVRPLLESGVSDEAIAAWFDSHGTPRSPGDVQTWSDSMEATLPYQNEDHRDWFVGECEKLHLNAKTTTLFDYLEADDRDSFKR